MTAMAKSQHNDGRNLYASRRADRREEAAARLAGRVVNPVSAVPEQSVKRLPGWVAFGVFGGLAILVHAIAVGALLASDGGDSQTKTDSEKVVFRVVETPQPPEQPRAPEAAPKPEPAAVPVQVVAPAVAPRIVEQPAPRRERKAVQRRDRPNPGRMATSDPVNQDASDPAPSARKRAVVGITMESTVTGGSGPAYAVGNTRMGSTAAVQSSQKIEKLTKSRQRSGSGGSGSKEVAAPVNKAATFIPTVSSNFTRPKRLSSVELPYPPELRQKGIEGNVMVLIVINEQGEVQKVRILKSSGYEAFDQAALNAAKKELYSPAKRDGKAVEYNLKYTYRFRIKGA